MNLALSATVWLAISGALLYSQGRAYRDAFLIGYGLNPEMLPWDRGAVAYWAMLVGVQRFFARFFMPSGLAPLVIAAIIIGIHDWQRRRATSTTPVARPSSAPTMPVGVRQCLGLAVAVIALGVLLTFFQWIQREAARLGLADAQRQIHAIDNCSRSVLNSPGYLPLHVERTTSTGPESYDEFAVACTEKRCALYDPARQQTHVVPLDQLIRLDTVPPEHIYWHRRIEDDKPAPAGE
ncbi:hypothetical protein [Burkholderia cenocepacia]|uniref:hypothetical protein n=1 Tax=Burkholderia cenocepacia TaxID=95486 RepID=UPI0024B75129|nr:hypothetical protein [Burkholderia cenocepacia]MDI9678675.1 hypothetical protein [Burkholderia cenocepacia]